MAICEMCGVGKVHFTVQPYKFPYGEPGPDQVILLPTPMVVWVCDNTEECGEMSMDWIGELIIQKTVDTYLFYLEQLEREQRLINAASEVQDNFGKNVSGLTDKEFIERLSNGN